MSVIDRYSLPVHCLVCGLIGTDAETQLNAYFTWGGLVLAEGIFLMVLYPLMEMLASKCARHND